MPDPIPAHIQKQANAWVMRLDRPRVGLLTRLRFRRWLRRSPEHARAFAQAWQLWSSLDPLCTQLDVAFATRPAARRTAWLWLAPAGALALAGALVARPELGACFARDCQRTGQGEIQHVQLADGIRLTLDAQTTVRIRGRHEIDLLRGQAIVDAPRRSDTPFTVNAAQAIIRNLGAVFQVSLLPEAQAAVLVERGQVRVQYGRQDQTLLAGQALYVAPSHTLSPVRAIDPGSAMAWREGRLVAQDEPLERVLPRLNAYRSDHLLTLDPTLAGQRLSGLFLTAEPEAALLSLEQALSLQALRLGPVTLLRRRP